MVFMDDGKKRTTQQEIAFLLQTIAHLSDHPTIREHYGEIIVAAEIVRKATDRQLIDATIEALK